MVTEYDKRELYKKKIEPAVKKIVRECGLDGIPMFATFAVRNTEDETEYASEMVFATTEKSLAVNNISKCLLKLNTFDTKFPDYILTSLRTISEYIAEMNENSSEMSEEIKLTYDILTDMSMIVKNKADLMFKAGVISKAIDDDIDDFPDVSDPE